MFGMLAVVMPVEIVSGPEQLRDWLTRRGVPQAELARWLGCTPQELSRHLSGVNRPGLERAIELERLTGIPVEAWARRDVAGGDNGNV